MRCLHLDRKGWQCPAEALEGSDLCADHTTTLDPDAGEAAGRMRSIYRLAALVLLLIFLLNAYHTLRQWLGL